MKRYSILTFMMGSYDCVREPVEISNDCEYVLVTDNLNLRSKHWKIKYIPERLRDADGFTKSFYVRYHPFEFVDTPLCVVMDASIKVLKPLDRLIQDFLDSGASIGLSVHWCQWNAHNEYEYWVKYRGYPKLQVARSMAFMRSIGYTPTYKGCFETTLKIQKNDEINNNVNRFVWDSLLKVGNGSADRVDQSIFSAVLNTLFEGIAVFPFTRSLYQGDYLRCYEHGSDKPLVVNIPKCDRYLFNKPVSLYNL